MELGLQDKVVVITGGATGIGKAAAASFLREGCKVAICSRSPEKLRNLEKEFEALGYSVLTAPADVSKAAEIMAFAQKVVDGYGKIDVWINNAAIYPQKMLMETSEHEWDEIMSNNLKSVFLGCKAVFPYMKHQGGGVILNASSFAALIPSVGSGVYAAAKAAINSLTRTLAAEMAPYKIRVNAYIPGLTSTDITKPVIEKNRQHFQSQIALNRIGEPEDIAESIVFLASDAARYMTGAFIEVSGGKFCVQNPHAAWQNID